MRKSIKYLDIHKVKAVNSAVSLTEEEINKFKNWYSCYHKLASCYKWKYKKLKTIKLASNMSSMSLTVSGCDLVPFKRSASLSITGVGVIIQGYVT